MAGIGVAGGKTVLVVDDDDSLRMLCRLNLELDGYQVVEASSIEDARTALAAGPVDAILLDLHVGQRDGRELLASLGEPRPPVALFTGSEAIGPELRATADAVLAKPFGIEVLAETVGRLIRAR
jgi:DNA-binding response OmpR family regulator